MLLNTIDILTLGLKQIFDWSSEVKKNEEAFKEEDFSQSQAQAIWATLRYVSSQHGCSALQHLHGRTRIKDHKERLNNNHTWHQFGLSTLERCYKFYSFFALHPVAHILNPVLTLDSIPVLKASIPWLYTLTLCKKRPQDHCWASDDLLSPLAPFRPSVDRRYLYCHTRHAKATPPRSLLGLEQSAPLRYRQSAAAASNGRRPH